VSDLDDLVEAMLERMRVLLADRRQVQRTEARYLPPMLKVGHELAADIETLDRELRAGTPLPERWKRRP